MDIKKIGINIAIIRKNKGYTQETLAEQLNISPQAISKWETGTGLPETSMLITLAELWSISIDSILRPSANEFDKIVETIIYKGVTFEVVSRPYFIWVGKLSYAPKGEGEPDIGKVINEYKVLASVPKNGCLNQDWTAAISMNYWYNYKNEISLGWMMAQETDTSTQDQRYDNYPVPASLYIRAQNDEQTKRATGEMHLEVFQLFGLIQDAMKEHGYTENYGPAQEFEYYGPNGAAYAYVPAKKV